MQDDLSLTFKLLLCLLFAFGLAGQNLINIDRLDQKKTILIDFIDRKDL